MASNDVEFTIPPCIYGREHNFVYRNDNKQNCMTAICDLCYYTPHRPPRTKTSTKRPKSLTGVSKVLRGVMFDICVYCGEQLCDRTRTVDHVVPRSRGGLDHLTNYVLACTGCNSEKGDQTLFDWLGVYDPPFLVYKDCPEARDSNLGVSDAQVPV